MRITALERAHTGLASDQTMSFLDRALKTYQLLRGLRVFIDIADDELLELSRQRDDALVALGESALRELESDQPTLDRAAFAETLSVLRQDLETLSEAATLAQSKYDAMRSDLERKGDALKEDVARINREIVILETRLRDLPDELEDRDPQIAGIAEEMVMLKDRLENARNHLEQHEVAAEQTLGALKQASQASQKAVAHVDGRLETVIRDLGRSVLSLDHDLAHSDPAMAVRSTRAEMRQIRHERDRAIQLMEQVDTTPVLHFLGVSAALLAALVGLGFWLI